MLAVLGERTKEFNVLRFERRIAAADAIAQVRAAIAEHGAPEFIRFDNGLKLIPKDFQQWLAAQKIKTSDITPASLWGKGFVESFYRRLRYECLNRGNAGR